MKNALVKVCLLICLIVMAVSGYKLWGYYHLYEDGKKEYEELKQYVAEEEAGPDEIPITVDFDKLKEINPDVLAWVYIKGTEVNYPVVQTTDNLYYLYHTFEKLDNRNGAIFMDTMCDPDCLSDNTILYGHNMKNGAMFGQLKRLYDIAYNKDADFRQHPMIWLITPTEAIEYQIYAAREIDVTDPADESVYLVAAGSMEDYQAYLDEQKAKSQYDTGVEVVASKHPGEKEGSEEPEDKNLAITLSTCTSSTENGRFVVQGIEIQRLPLQ